jgi:hypothetical protein
MPHLVGPKIRFHLDAVEMIVKALNQRIKLQGNDIQWWPAAIVVLKVPDEQGVAMTQRIV